MSSRSIVVRPRARALSSCGAVLVAAACASGQGPRPPATRVAPAVDTLHGQAIEDRYRWLEAQDAPEVRAWIAAQDGHARRVLAAHDGGPALRARLQALLDVPAASSPQRGGEWEYFTLRRRGEEAGGIYRRRWGGAPAPVDPDGTYEPVVSALARRADGTTSVGLEGVARDGALLLYSVRDGGADEVTLHVRDLRAGRDLPDSLPWALYASMSLAPDGRGLHYVHRSRTTGPRYRYHAFGTPVARDSTLFGEGLAPTAFLAATTSGDGRWRVYTVSHGWARNALFVQDVRTGSVTDATHGIDAHVTAQVIDGALWLRTDHGAPRGRLVTAPLDTPDVAHWREVIAGGPDVLDAFTMLDGRLYVTYIRDVAHRIAVFTRDGTPAGELAVPPASSVTLRGAGPGAALLTVTSFTQPALTWHVDLATGARRTWEASPVPVDTAAFEVRQHWYRSADGTRAPLYVVQRRGAPRRADTPALLTGYGGFALSLLPRFDARAIAWVERGGIFVQATLRGGNEFGEAWHRAGMLANKPRVFDDFTAAAQFLVDSGFTRPDRLAIRGTSNGGLLMGAAITRRPDLFAAAFLGFPDLDILRFPWFPTHNNAPALLEYGDARRADEAAVIAGFSPYQQLRDGVRYPAALVQTGLNDTRVPPWGARRFAARLQAIGDGTRPALLLHDLRSGHAGGRSTSGTVELAAQELGFLLWQLGVRP